MTVIDCTTPHDRMMAQLTPQIEEIAKRYGLKQETLMAKLERVPKRLVEARREVYALLYDRAGPYKWSLPRIGRHFDLDHTTIMFHLHNASEELHARYLLPLGKSRRVEQ